MQDVSTASRRIHVPYMRDGVPVLKNKVASFFGSSFVAERADDGTLNIYLVSADPVPMSTAGDWRAPAPKERMTAAAMQALNRAAREAEKTRQMELRP